MAKVHWYRSKGIHLRYTFLPGSNAELVAFTKNYQLEVMRVSEILGKHRFSLSLFFKYNYAIQVLQIWHTDLR